MFLLLLYLVQDRLSQSVLQLLLIQLEAPVLGKSGSFLLSLQAVLDSFNYQSNSKLLTSAAHHRLGNVAQRVEAICQRTHSLWAAEGDSIPVLLRCCPMPWCTSTPRSGIKRWHSLSGQSCFPFTKEAEFPGEMGMGGWFVMAASCAPDPV